MSTKTLRNVMGRWAVAALVAVVLIGAAAPMAAAGGKKEKRHVRAEVAASQAPVAHAVLYEVAEALKFKGPRAATSPEDFKRRLAEATLIGKEVSGQPGTVFGDSQFVVAYAKSNVNLSTGTGPLRGEFHLLKDLDPTRESLDTLVVTGSFELRGTIDLSTATQGYATMRGHWGSHRWGHHRQGDFTGIFLIPFQAGGYYWYLDLGPSQGACAVRMTLPMPDGTSVSACRLASDEFSLGLPLTKAIVVLYD